MLILNRRLDETVLVGTDIAVTIVAVNGSQVRLGIDAPKDVRVLREEIFRREQGRHFVPRVRE